MPEKTFEELKAEIFVVAQIMMTGAKLEALALVSRAGHTKHPRFSHGPG